MKLLNWRPQGDFRVFNLAGKLVRLDSLTDPAELRALYAREVQAQINLSARVLDALDRVRAHDGGGDYLDVEVDENGDEL